FVCGLQSNLPSGRPGKLPRHAFCSPGQGDTEEPSPLSAKTRRHQDTRTDSNRLQGALIGLHRPRSEEHTSELQSHSDLVCRLLLEKKKTSAQWHSGASAHTAHSTRQV